MTTHLLPYNDGTVMVTAGSSAVTGALTAFLAAVKPGDVLHAQGHSVAVLSVTNNTSVTLVRPWPGTTATLDGATWGYEIRRGVGWNDAADLNLKVAELIRIRPNGTSVSSLAIGTGSKTFAVQSGLPWQPGAPIRASVNDDATKWMQGVVTSYSGTSAVIDMLVTSGHTSTHSAWFLNYSGPQGPTGLSGPQGPPGSSVVGTNLIVNGDFGINQRAFAFGALADGAFGVDRWRASGASNLGWDAATQTLTLNSGAIRQVVEPLVWGYSNLASFQITASVEELTGGNLMVAVGSVSGVITPGSGRRSVTLTLGAGDTGNLAVTLTPASYPTLWKRVKLELGAAATAWQARPTVEEVALCMRYYQNGFPNGVAPVDGYTFTQSYYASGISDTGNRLYAVPVTFQVPMRATPTVFVFRSNVAATTSGRWQYFNGSAWVAGSSTFPGTINEKGFRMTVDGTGLTAGSSYLLIGGWEARSEL